jgi:glycosyltransferase involved in cell wall biosynthesis
VEVADYNQQKLQQDEQAQSFYPLRKEDVTIVIPVLNEEEAIGPVLQELGDLGYSNILVVDGYSTDSTVRIVEKFGVPVVEQHGPGKTGAITSATEFVSTPYFLVMDGDYTYDPRNIDRFLAHAENYDEIIGRRKTKSHALGNVLLTKVFNLLMGTNVSDLCSGMYLLKTNSARHLALSSNGFNVEAEIAAQISKNGSITEVPIHYRERMGKQKLSMWRDGFKIFMSIFHLAREYNPVFLFSWFAGLLSIPGIVLLSLAGVNYTFFGAIDWSWLVVGGGLVFLGTQSLVAGTISLVMKRSEKRISNQIRELKGK